MADGEEEQDGVRETWSEQVRTSLRVVGGHVKWGQLPE